MFKCEVCGEETKHWGRCPEHYRCNDCGAREDLCFYGKQQGGLLCGACKEKRVQKQIAEWKGDTRYQDVPVCPWCGYEMVDYTDYENGRNTCPNCERDFELEIIITPTFSTEKAEEKGNDKQ